MPIQNIIKSQRKELGLTQEQIANYLGISTPAVNKWENGATYPDISLLSPLARLLKVDLNTLLCFQEELTDQEILQFSNEVVMAIKQNGLDCGVTMIQQKIEEYPNCSKLIHNSVLLLDGTMLMTGVSSDEKKKYEIQINALYERATKSDDDEVRNGARFMLASKYINQEKFDKAHEILDLLPERSAMDKRLLQANLLDKEGKSAEAEGIYERRILMEVTEIWNNLLSLLEIEIKIGNIQNASKLAELSSQSAELFQLPDYYKYAAPFMLAGAKKNEEESILLMESFLSSTLKKQSFTDSFLYQHIPMKNNSTNTYVQILPALLNEIESNTKYDFLRKNERYQQLIKQYHREYEENSTN